ncbi:hypothetical protein [Amycolatopsis sp. cmx-11-32]|uniref:hypothetical protein n=1 Tax=Amycolatopsis sp. cmx-11-32 TaxID=2785796 RepID=UPI0039E56FD5
MVSTIGTGHSAWVSIGSGPHDQTVAGVGAVAVVARVRVVVAVRREWVGEPVLHVGVAAPG